MPAEQKMSSMIHTRCVPWHKTCAIEHSAELLQLLLAHLLVHQGVLQFDLGPKAG
jgi:hypothetical protein